MPASRIYYLGDANYNVTALVNPSGTVVERYVYQPYGRATIYSGDWSSTRPASSVGNTILFAGESVDTETGLLYCDARYYSVTLGSFISQDPTGYAGGGPSLYCYCSNNPIGATDPTGLFPWIAGGVLGVGAVWASASDTLFRRPACRGGVAPSGSGGACRRSVVLTKQADGSTLVTVNEDDTVVILFGHGDASKPHKFKVFSVKARVGFVGCDADATNGKILPRNVIPGLEPIKGDLVGWKTDNGWGFNAMKLIKKNAVGEAAKMIAAGVKAVTITGRCAYAGEGQDNMQMPWDWTDVVTAENLSEMEAKYSQ